MAYSMALTTKVTVSVIVTVHDSGPLLRGCLQSLAAQTLSGLEVIVVNDCSPNPIDKEIIEEFCVRDSRFTQIHNSQNQGTGQTRSIGVAAARGEFIGFLDYDDYCEPATYSKLYNSAVNNDADIAVADFITVPSEDLIFQEQLDDRPDELEVITGKELFNRQVRRIRSPYYLRIDWWNKIYRRALFIDNDFNFPKVTRNEGTASLLMSLLAVRCVVIDWQAFYTRVLPGSVSREFKVKNINDTLESMSYAKSELKRFGFWENHKDDFENLFYFIVFNINLKRISRLDTESCLYFSSMLKNSILHDFELRHGFLKYLSRSDRHTELRVFHAISSWSVDHDILREIHNTDFFSRKEGGKRARSSKRRPPTARPLVTIVTITLDLIAGGRRSHFEQMLTSVRNQDYGRENIEHVVVDGGSNDGTIELIKEFDRKGEIDYWISESDSGVYNAMNKGWKLARGNFVMYLNSDDYLSSSAVSSLVRGIRTSQADYAFGNAKKVNENNREVGSHIGNMDKIFFGSPYCHQALMCKRDCFERVPFDESYKLTMWPFALDLYFCGLKHVHVDSALAFFRVGGLSTESEFDKFTKEQTRVKSERIAPVLGLSMNEFEFLNHSIRGWSNAHFDVDHRGVLDKIRDNPSEFARDFLRRLENLLLARKIVQKKSI